MRPEDRDVHLERHKPATDLPKEEREGKVHCPKGCGRWVDTGTPDGQTHATLCDGSEPISAIKNSAAYRWWCEEHQFGTNGPMPWGVHKKEHHRGKEPVGKPPQEKRRHHQATVVPEVLKLLRGELQRLQVEQTRIEGEAGRISAAIRALEADLRSVGER
jgi:hypothetical protein